MRRHFTEAHAQLDEDVSPEHLLGDQASRSSHNDDLEAAASDGTSSNTSSSSPCSPAGRRISGMVSTGARRNGVPGEMSASAEALHRETLNTMNAEIISSLQPRRSCSSRIVFNKELALHVSIFILSITVPFALPVSLSWLAAMIPLSLWCTYVTMFVEGAEHPHAEQGGFGRFKCSAVAAMKILPRWVMLVLSLCFISVVTVATLTAAMLGGSPLCVASCSSCLASWTNAQPLFPDTPSDSNQACGFANGKELLAYHTLSQITIIIYFTLMLGLLICLAWRVSEEELEEREDAKERLLAQSPLAFELREKMISEHGSPESRVFTEPQRSWIFFGVLFVLCLAPIGLIIRDQLPPNIIAVIMNGATVTAAVTSLLVLHVGFHGTLIALHDRNLQYVKFLSNVLCESMSVTNEPRGPVADVWWKLRSFVIEKDMSLHYDIARPGFSASVAVVIVTFVFATVQTALENFVPRPPASYCYAVMMYTELSLVSIFGLANNARKRQQRHARYIEVYLEYVATAKMIASFSSLSSAMRGMIMPPAEGVPISSILNSSEPQEQQPELLLSGQSSITGVVDYGENTQRDSSGNTENASSVRVRGRGCIAEGIRRFEEEIRGLLGSSERAVRVIERSAAANVTDSAQEAMRRMVEHMKNEPYPNILGIPIKIDFLVIALYVLPNVVYAIVVWVAIIKGSTK